MEGTTGMGLNMGSMVYTIEISAIHERKFYVCIAHPDPKVSSLHKKKKKRSLIDWFLQRR